MSGKTGLCNLGNTCYLNSTLQIMSHIPELNNYLNKYNPEKYNNIIDKHLVIEWIELYNLMWSKDCIISPKRFLFFLRELSFKKNALFSGNDQNDAVEYFYFVIDCFHNSLNNTDNLKLSKTNYKNINDAIDLYEKTNSSIIHRLFSSFIINNYINEETHAEEFNKIETNFTIELIIPNINENISIEQCIEYTFKTESMPDLWLDDKTNTRKKLKKNTKICYLPQILVLHLKRWDYTLRKNNKLITYQSNIDMYPFTMYNNAESCNYELFGIINHQGSVMGGHYYAYIKNNNQWLMFNDMNVSKVSNIMSSDNYCFFYRKIK
jgi:ubiquitin carboxyl-terminal hydrolase 8